MHWVLMRARRQDSALVGGGVLPRAALGCRQLPTRVPSARAPPALFAGLLAEPLARSAACPRAAIPPARSPAHLHVELEQRALLLGPLRCVDPCEQRRTILRLELANPRRTLLAHLSAGARRAKPCHGTRHSACKRVHTHAHASGAARRTSHASALAGGLSVSPLTLVGAKNADFSRHASGAPLPPADVPAHASGVRSYITIASAMRA
eukprot:591319-Prymnesium_polylepis.1